MREPKTIILDATERRMLVLAMGIISYTQLICQVEDERLVAEMEANLERSVAEYEELFDKLGDQHKQLIEKLS